MREGECPMIEGNGILTIHLLLIIIGIVSKFLCAALIEGTENDTFAAGKQDAHFLSLHLRLSDFACYRIVKNSIRSCSRDSRISISSVSMMEISSVGSRVSA